MQEIKSIHSRVLDLPPSCIAFCPSKPQYFVVGTYYLHPKSEGPIAAVSVAPITHANDANSVVGAPSLTSDEQDDIDGVSDAGPVDSDTTQKRTGSLMLFQLDGDTMYVRHTIP